MIGRVHLVAAEDEGGRGCGCAPQLGHAVVRAGGWRWAALAFLFSSPFSNLFLILFSISIYILGSYVYICVANIYTPLVGSTRVT